MDTPTLDRSKFTMLPKGNRIVTPFCSIRFLDRMATFNPEAVQYIAGRGVLFHIDEDHTTVLIEPTDHFPRTSYKVDTSGHARYPRQIHALVNGKTFRLRRDDGDLYFHVEDDEVK